MRIFDPRFVDNDQVSLVTSLASEFGSTDEMTINFVVAEDFPQTEIDIWRGLIDSEINGPNRRHAVEHLTMLVHKMIPFVGKPIVRSGVWHNGKLHMMYIDRNARSTIHSWAVEYPAPSRERDRAPEQKNTNNPMDRSGGSAAS